MEQRANDLYPALARAIYLAAGVFLFFWFLDAITLVALFFAVAFILAIALNPPVTWLELRKLPRIAATLIVCLGVAAVAALLGWLVVPRLVQEVTGLVEQLPEYTSLLVERASRLLADYPALQERLRLDGRAVERLLPSLQSVLLRVGRYSLSLFGLVIFGIILVSTVVYTLARPRPLLQGYVSAMPPHLRDPATRAFARGSQAVTGWIWSNVIVGGIEGVAAALFLSFMGIPGALVWGVVTFFAELVPKLGPYLMAIPPIIVALAVDPMDALWVALFYVVLQEITGDVIAPLVRSSTMNLHPVSLLFAVLAMGSVFGLLGALIATPITGFVKAYYEEFYLARQPKDERQEERVETMLTREVDPEAKRQPQRRVVRRRQRSADSA